MKTREDDSKKASFHVLERSGEVIVGNKGGVFKCRDFRQKTGAERWNLERLNELIGFHGYQCLVRVMMKLNINRYARSAQHTNDRDCSKY